jgi:hypothetical protein
MVAQALRAGATQAQVHESCAFDPWFIAEIAGIVDMEEKVRVHGLARDAANFRRLKSMGFSDARLAELAGSDEDAVRKRSPRPRAPPGLQAHRHECCRIRLAHRLHVLHLRDRHPGRRRQRGRAIRPREDHHSRRRPQPHRPGHRVRLLLLPRRVRALRRRLRNHHDQLQPRDRVDRLRHVRPALFRAADRRGRAGDHLRSSRATARSRASSSSSAARRR